MVERLAQIAERALALPKTRIAVAKAEDKELLKALADARTHGLAEAVLLGDKKRILELMEELSLPADTFEIQDLNEDIQIARTAVSLVTSGQAEILMKGMVDTRTLLREVLSKASGLRQAEVLSHLALFEVPTYPKLLGLTDAAINIGPGVEAKYAIINNALQVTAALGLEETKVALLAAIEKVNPQMSATVHAEALRGMSYHGAVVDGPFALDNAVSKAGAAAKGIDSVVAGDADILLAPDIDAGNILYKALNFLAGAHCAGIILGARAPIVLTSRADSEATRFYSIALAVVMTDHLKEANDEA